MPTCEMVRGIAAAALACALCATVAAQGTSGSASWLDEIATIEAQTQLLKKRDELRKELEKSTAGTIATLPMVVSIMALEGVPQAQLFYPSGRISHAKVGMLVAPLVRIAAISELGVEVDVTRGRATHRMPLEFATIETRFPAQAGASNGASAGDEQVPTQLLPEPPAVRTGSPLPAGMLQGAGARAQGSQAR